MDKLHIAARCKTWMLLIATAIVVGSQLTQAIAAPASAKQRVLWAYELQRVQAHARMKNTMYASTRDRPDATVMCPVLSDGRLGPPIALDLHGAYLKADSKRFSAKDEESELETDSASDFFLNHISGPIVQAKCVNCHVEGGVSGHTRLVLYSSANPDHGALNLAVFENFLADVEDGANLILNKIQGVAHGGGVQVAAGSDDLANMERFLSLLGHGDGSGPGLSPETLFDSVTMTSPGRTLRRAALVFGGRVPTREEREAVDNGTEADLRTAIRNLMTGPGFHRFLIRAANDRLLTDRHLELALDPNIDLFVDLANLQYFKKLATIEKGYDHPWHDPEFGYWWEQVQYGFARAPLELIAHVVENDLPYTEVLTADYIMANPEAAEAYGDAPAFDDPEDPLEFRPSQILSYYRNDDSKVAEYHEGIGANILDPGNLATDYPHAGILNTSVFLRRYPTTPTNRNRARSRWTYYHFLGLDIEKSASRTTDPVALADTDNPTLNNPACTVCHRVMDPVAGAFQNYGEEGLYRDEWEGLDSLDTLYKYPEDGSYSPYQYGDAWYRDMREPGFNGELAPNAENSLQWLAEKIVADDRFAEATVKFWWPTIVGVEIATPPEDENDSDFEAMLLTSSAQIMQVERLAEEFRSGIAGGEPYNLKDLLVEIVLSPWFRAESIEDEDPVRAAALRLAGVDRLLTPEELAWKTESITGYGWGKNIGGLGIESKLTRKHDYRLLYGGIDSDGVTDRAGDMTALMAAVAQSHALESSCPIVGREFLLWPDEKRRLFAGIDEDVTPVFEFGGTAVIEVESWKNRQTVSVSGPLSVGTKIVRVGFLNDFYDEDTKADRNLILDQVLVRNHSGKVVKRVALENVDSQDCGSPYWDDSRERQGGYKFWCGGWLDVPVSIPAAGDYRIEVVAYQEPAGDEDARLGMVVESDTEISRGARTIRNKLVELHETLLGVTVSLDSPDVDAAFRLFVEVWEQTRLIEDPWAENVICDIDDQFFFEGIAEDALVLHTPHDGYPYYDFDWERVDEIRGEVDWWGRSGHLNPVIRTWVVVLAYLLTDYRYLFL